MQRGPVDVKYLKVKPGVRIGRRMILSFRGADKKVDVLCDCGYDNFDLVLDREDNDGHYSPGNLRFVTRRESLLNRRSA